MEVELETHGSLTAWAHLQVFRLEQRASKQITRTRVPGSSDSRLTPAFPFSRIGYRIALRRDSRGPEISGLQQKRPGVSLQTHVRA